MGTNYYEKRHLYSDAELVACYQKYESQIKAAAELEVSRETIARAVRRAGIVLTGRRNNGKYGGNYGGGSPRKITDEELIAEAKTMTRAEIAEKHNMCICNVDRKLSKLGIHCKRKMDLDFSGKTRHYKERMIAPEAGYDRTINLKKVMQRDHGICQICGKPVDLTSRIGGGVGRLYPTIDHIIPLSKGGGHTWDNVRLAHMVCNSIKCDKEEYKCQDC